MTRATILDEVRRERERQDTMFGGTPHDDTHSATDWGAIIVRHLGLAFDDGKPADVCFMNDHCAGHDPVRYRRQLVRVAAIAVAALETFDRKTTPALPEPSANGYAHGGEDVRGTADAGGLWGATEATPPTRLTPREWAQAVADREGAVMLLFDRRQDVMRRVVECSPYLIREDQADPWEAEAKNRLARVEPTDGGQQ